MLTIAHPKHRDTFGEVLDYAGPGEAQALVQRYVDDPEAYRTRVERTISLVRERFGHDSFVERLRPLLPCWAGADAAQHEDPVDEADGPVAERLPLRGAADGERADELWVIHRNVQPAVLRRWLAAHVPDPVGPTWDLGPLLAAAPVGVDEVRLRRDGTIVSRRPDRATGSVGR
nr:hypothetical protein [Serinicoccus sp. CUA-874]